jgi:PAS domain S-box-containing protein
MNDAIDVSVEAIVTVLLQVGERVVEVSREQVMTRIWDRPGSPLSAFKTHYEGKKIAEIRNDSTIARCRAGIDEAFATGQGCYIEYISHNNDVDAVLTFSFRVLACHPDKDFVFLVIENISRGNEDTLVEDKWKLAVDASNQGVWDANMENQTIFFSQKWEELFGYAAKEITAIKDWSEKVHPEDRANAERRLQEYFSGQSPVYSAEVRYRCMDGSYKWILSRGVVVSRKADGSPVRFIGTHSDISARKKMEEELQQAKETFANSFHYSGTGKALIAPGGKWLEVNNVICELTEYTREELLELHYRDITFPEDVDIDLPLIQKLLSRELSSYSIEKRYVSKSRRVLTTVITVSLVWSEDEKPKYFVCDIVDMTRKKAITDELNRKNRALETTSANLLKKINQLEELNNIIAHNLRGPAGNIKLLSGPDRFFPEEEAMNMIYAASLSLISNLDMMVEIARIKLDKETAYDSCSVLLIIQDITRQLQGIIYQENISIIPDLEVEELSYPRLYLESIIYNLISNAIKYRRKDIPPVIRISTKTAGGRVQLTVRDNGIGIDLEQYGSKIFKLNQIFHEGYDSKGVGLFITKTQIESLGGTIEVQSKPNEGCSFVVTF